MTILGLEQVFDEETATIMDDDTGEVLTIDDAVDRCVHEVDEGELTTLKLLLQDVLIYGFRGNLRKFAAAIAAEVTLSCKRCGKPLPYGRVKDELELWALDARKEIMVH